MFKTLPIPCSVSCVRSRYHVGKTNKQPTHCKKRNLPATVFNAIVFQKTEVISSFQKERMYHDLRWEKHCI